MYYTVYSTQYIILYIVLSILYCIYLLLSILLVDVLMLMRRRDGLPSNYWITHISRGSNSLMMFLTNLRQVSFIQVLCWI